MIKTKSRITIAAEKDEFDVYIEFEIVEKRSYNSLLILVGECEDNFSDWAWITWFIKDLI